MPASTADPKANIILDFIAGGVPGNPSGESDGNYDAEIGLPHATLDLSKMTIAQVYDEEAVRRANGMPSDAIGRYQFIHSTLSSLVKQAAVPLTALFTHALQDQFAMMLLRGRGLAQWEAGTLGDATFVHNLSLEWASLPDPLNGGRSHYDGDSAGNHASTSLVAVYAMLAAARTATGQPVPTRPVTLPPVSDTAKTQLLKSLQTMLKGRELYTGEIDGIWGAGSEAAMRRFANG